jgi:hypothetical protein
MSHETTTPEITAWFHARLPQEWTAAGQPEVTADREEITVVLALETPAIADDLPADADPAVVQAQAVAGRIAGFRDDTRQRRMAIADEAEHRFERKVAWGVRINETSTLFTHLAVPVMTRLRQPERQVLDTLVAAGVARSRSDALAWCVRLVGRNTDEWLRDLRAALHDVERLRADGPPV